MTKHSIFSLSFKRLLFLSLCLFLLTSHVLTQGSDDPPVDDPPVDDPPVDDPPVDDPPVDDPPVDDPPVDDPPVDDPPVDDPPVDNPPEPDEEEEEETPVTPVTPDEEEEEEEEEEVIPTNPGREDITFAYDSWIRFHWTGGLTSHSISLRVFPTNAFLTANRYLYVARYTKIGDKNVNTADLTVLSVSFSTGVGMRANLEFTSLTPAQKYYYMFFTVPVGAAAPTAEDFNTKVGGDTTNMLYEFSFRTMGIALTASSFTFGVGCCAQTSSNNEVFRTLAERGLDFFIYAGDIHSEKINTDATNVFYDAYYRIFDSVKQKEFFQSTPVVYVWDDNDFGARGNATAKAGATAAFKNFVPYNTLKNPLPVDDKIQVASAPAATAVSSTLLETFDNTGTDGVFRSFIYGRCLFIILDLRSFKDLADKDILGSNQMNWLKNQLVFVSKNAGIKQVFIVSTLPWNNKDADTDWSPYEEVQVKIAGWVNTYVNTGGIGSNKNIMMLGGNGGFIAFDDGTNNEHGKFPVVQAGALDDTPSCQGGAYSHGLVKGRQQFGSITVSDNGNTVCLKVKLERNGAPLIQYDTCKPTEYEGVKDTCSTSLLDSITDVITGGDSSDKVSKAWMIIAIVALSLLGLVVIVMFICMIVSCVKRRRNSKSGSGARLSNDDIYLEMTEKKGKKKKGKN